MSLRTTRQYVEVLTRGAGKLRVTRQYAEVLVSVGGVEGDASDTLTLAHGADCNLERIIGAVDTLSLSHSAAGDAIKSIIVIDTLAMTIEASEQSVFARAVADTLVVTQEVVVGFTKRVWSTDVLSVDDEALVDLIRPVVHTLTLTQLAEGDVVRWVADTLTLTDAAVMRADYGRAAVDAVTVSDVASVQTVLDRSVQDTASLTEEAIGHLCKVGITTLEITDQAEVELIRPVDDNLVLTHEVGSNWVFYRPRIDTLSLSHVVEVLRARDYAAATALVLTDEAAASVVRTVVDTLALTDEASAEATHCAADTLTLTDTADVLASRLLVTDELLGMSDLAVVGFVKSIFAADTLHLTDRGRSGIEIGIATHLLQELHYNYDEETGELVPYYVGLQDSADVAVVRAAPYEAVSTLALSHQALAVAIHPDAIAGDVVDDLALLDANIVEQWPVVRDAIHAADSLVLAQAAVVALVRPAADTLDVTDEATVVTWRATLPVTDTLQLGHSVGFVLVQAHVLEQYTPFIGEGTSGPTPPPASCPVPVAGIGECRFCYPVSHPTEFVTLRSPEFGNRDRLQFNRISRETRGGTLIVFADPMWPKVETMVLTFSGLSSTQVQDYLMFVRDHLGLEVGFVDWEGFYWKGVIMDPTEPTAQDDKTGHTISVAFECESATWEP